MDLIIKECLRINDVFETEYIYKSVVICKSPKYFYHIENILKDLLYPVEILTHMNFGNTISEFHKGNIRMLIISELMFNILLQHFTFEFEAVNIIFLSENIILKQNYTEFSDKKIFNLSSV
jgi:hypothetical protein